MNPNFFLRRFGVVGDIHGESSWLERALSWFGEQGQLDAILSVGDIVDGGGSADACIRLLADHAVDVVRGNHDRWMLTNEMRHFEHATLSLALKSRAFLESLPEVRLYDSPMGRIMLCHGFGRDDEAQAKSSGIVSGRFAIEKMRAELRKLSVKILICGHTHRAELFIDNGTQVINAGCLRPHRGPTAVLVDTIESVVRFYRLHNGSELRSKLCVIQSGAV